MPAQPVTLASRFIVWWYDWGVFLFTFIAVALVGWLFSDAKRRRQQEMGWQLMVALPALLLLPSLLMRISARSMLSSPHLLEPFFWLGILGGTVTILATIGYSLQSGAAPPAPPQRPTSWAPRPAPVPYPEPQRSATVQAARPQRFLYLYISVSWAQRGSPDPR